MHYGKEVSMQIHMHQSIIIYQSHVTSVMEMLEKRTQEYEIQLTKTNDELRTNKEQLVKVSQQEAALVQQNAKMSVELVAGEKGQKSLENELKLVKEQLRLRETELDNVRGEMEKMKTRHKSESEGQGKEMEEKNKTVKEYQEKVSYTAVLSLDCGKNYVCFAGFKNDREAAKVDQESGRRESSC